MRRRRWSRTRPGVLTWSEFQRRHAERAYLRPRPARAARLSAQPADAVGSRLAVDRRGRPAGGIFPGTMPRDPFPRGRSLRDCRPGTPISRSRSRTAWNPACTGCDCAAAASRTSCPPTTPPPVGVAPPRRSSFSSSTFTYQIYPQPPALQCRRGVPGRGRRNGAPIHGTRRITRNTPPRPTTRTPTAAAISSSEPAPAGRRGGGCARLRRGRRHRGGAQATPQPGPVGKDAGDSDGAGRCAPAPRPARPPPPQRRGHRPGPLARRRRRSGLTGRRERRMPGPAITRAAWPRAASSASTGRISGMLPPPWNTAARTHAKGGRSAAPARGRASAGRGDGGRNSTSHTSHSWGSPISSVWFEPLITVRSR